MQNQSILSSSKTAPAASGLKASFALQYDEALSSLTGLLEHACAGQASLIPYAVRHALDQVLEGTYAHVLVKEIMALPVAEDRYTRHVLYADPKGRFTVVALVWGKDQFSPVHAHFTWCAYKVLSGLLTESHFEWNRMTESVRLSGRVERAAGQSVCGHAGLELIHQLGNTRAERAVSIHVYGMDAERIGTHVNRVLVSPNNA